MLIFGQKIAVIRFLEYQRQKINHILQTEKKKLSIQLNSGQKYYYVTHRHVCILYIILEKLKIDLTTNFFPYICHSSKKRNFTLFALHNNIGTWEIIFLFFYGYTNKNRVRTYKNTLFIIVNSFFLLASFSS